MHSTSASGDDMTSYNNRCSSITTNNDDVLYLESIIFAFTLSVKSCIIYLFKSKSNIY